MTLIFCLADFADGADFFIIVKIKNANICENP